MTSAISSQCVEDATDSNKIKYSRESPGSPIGGNSLMMSHQISPIPLIMGGRVFSVVLGS
jgi:hypothetical protein